MHDQQVLSGVLTWWKADMEKKTRASNSQFFVSDACNSFSLRPSGQHESWP